MTLSDVSGGEEFRFVMDLGRLVRVRRGGSLRCRGCGRQLVVGDKAVTPSKFRYNRLFHEECWEARSK